MSDGLKILLGALGGAILALLLAGGFSGSGMAQAQCERMWLANPPRCPTMVSCTRGQR